MQDTKGVFLDGTCPQCSRHCGNGGQGMTLHCQCGWSGGLSEHDTKLLKELWKRHQERNQAVRDDT